MTSGRIRAADGSSAPGVVAGATRIDAGALLRRAAAGGGAQAGPHLVVREPRALERVVALTGDCTVGRGREVALRLADPSASRLHLRLQVDAAGASVVDLGSRNGLRVNGGRARGLRRLRSGDRLEVGETLLRYVDPLQPIGEVVDGPRTGLPRPPTAALLAVTAGLLAASAVALALS
jgi:pSer/pThr/pTyr-binding forkhead associated (FHA) protein